MSMEKSDDADGRYAEICGATTRDGDPCKLPAGWGTPGSGGERCKFHGGASTGPSETDYLEGNDYAEGNPGGSPPDGNTNAEIHGGFADWQKAYDRFDADTRAFVEHLRDCMRERASADVSEERREALLKEHATLSMLWRRAAADTAGTPKNPVDGARGFVIEEEIEESGETYTRWKLNPALDATTRISARKRQIAEELSLYPGGE